MSRRVKPGGQATGHEAVLAGIGEVARDHLGIEAPLDPSAALVDDLELDSIRLLTLAVEVENRFRVALQPEDEASIRTVDDLAAVVAGKLASTPAEDADG